MKFEIPDQFETEMRVLQAYWSEGQRTQERTQAALREMSSSDITHFITELRVLVRWAEEMLA